MAVVNCNPEFGIELVLAVPYAYWLYEHGELDGVITSTGMKPFYFFTDNVEERYTFRTIDNKAANMDSLPNNWIYGPNSNVEPGVLNYDQWSVPPFKDFYKNDEIIFDKPYIVVSNKYNWEHGHEPYGFFDIKCLYEMFNYLTDKGYTVIYKRPKNDEFPLDQNEIVGLRQGFRDIVSDVEGIGKINDFQLATYYDGVYCLDDLLNTYSNYSYNELQLKLYANASGFISVGGGNCLLCCLFQKPTVVYFGGNMVESCRPNFWTKNNYHFKINPLIKPVLDNDRKIMLNDEYREFIETIKNTFIGEENEQ